MTAELVHLAADLQMRDLGVQVEAVDAGHVQNNVTVETSLTLITLVIAPACTHEGGLCPPDNLSRSPGRVGGGWGEGLPSPH